MASECSVVTPEQFDFNCVARCHGGVSQPSPELAGGLATDGFLREKAKRLVGGDTAHSMRSWLERKMRDTPKSLRRVFFGGISAFQAKTADKLIEIHAGVASIPGRRSALKQAVDSMLPQVDRIYVYLNDYFDVPDFLVGPKIEVFRSQERGARGAGGKFFGVTRARSGLYFAFDDDIVYPPDYVATMVKALRACQFKAVVGVHACYYPSRPRSFLDGSLSHFRKANAVRIPVSLLGTATVAFPLELVPITPDVFKSQDRADLWFAKFLKDHSIPAVLVERSAAWLRDAEHDTLSLFDRAFMDCRPHSGLLREGGPWGVGDLLDRSRDIEHAMAPAWRAFGSLRRAFYGQGPGAAAQYLLRPPGAKGSQSIGNDEFGELLAIVQLACELDEQFEIARALSEVGEAGVPALVALIPGCAAINPAEAADILRRAFERAPGSDLRSKLAALAIRNYRLVHRTDEAKAFLTSLSGSAPFDKGLMKEDIRVSLARGEYVGSPGTELEFAL